ncbi:MAG: hypothetical protein AAF564_16990 [Bacteroidota bacterium]
MSVVACRILPDGYEIASDSITVRWATQSKGENTKFSKLFEINGLAIGSVGSAEEASLLQMYCKTRQPAAANEQDLLEFMSEFANWKKTKVSKSDITNHYIIGFEGKVYSVAGWFIQEVVTYEAIGAGMDYALAALYLGNSAHDAVKVACELSIFCEEPIQSISKTTAKRKPAAAKKKTGG